MKVKVNIELFDKLKIITSHISMLNGIIQNDMEISEKELAEWKKDVGSNVKELWKWHLDVEKWILR